MLFFDTQIYIHMLYMQLTSAGYLATNNFNLKFTSRTKLLLKNLTRLFLVLCASKYPTYNALGLNTHTALIIC